MRSLTVAAPHQRRSRGVFRGRRPEFSGPVLTMVGQHPSRGAV